MHEQFAIFIEPPGNIQKELHSIRLAVSELSQTAEILGFPDIIPVCCIADPKASMMQAVELHLRGHISIETQGTEYGDFLFLPTTMDIPLSFPGIECPRLPQAWRFGHISMGKKTQKTTLQTLNGLHNSLQFAGGRLLLAKLRFLDDWGTSFSIQILETQFRKKQ